MAHNTSHLPPEILEIILSKLSLKPLVRFRSVCKSWNTMISDPGFIRHRRSTYSNSDNLFLCHDVRRSSSNSFSVVKVEDKKLLTVRKIECPYGGRWQKLCFCEGVILLTDGTYRRFDVWNPYTRTSTKLCHFYYCCGASFGLCCDPTTDDFKVVIVDYCSYWVYSRNNKSWTTKEKFAIEYTNDYRKEASDPSGVCVDGASYWAWSVENVKQFSLLYFDPRDDELKMLQKPKSLAHNQPIHLVDLKGSLCMYCCKGSDETRVQIWTKEKGIDNHSWKELMTVENVYMHLSSFQPLCLDGNKIVIQIHHDKLVCYSPSEKRFEEFEGNTRVLGPTSVPIPYVLPL